MYRISWKIHREAEPVYKFVDKYSEAEGILEAWSILCNRIGFIDGEGEVELWCEEDRCWMRVFPNEDL